MSHIRSTLMYPCPSSISYMWNFGFLLGLSFMMQIITGLFLSFHYSPSVLLAFDCISHLMENVNSGFLVRFFHSNGASLIFFLMYCHIARGIYYKSFIKNKFTWISGVTLYLLFMISAFLGYVLPWGQMSFWGATVITNLISVLYYIGPFMVEWIWGGFSVGGPTLNRFFSLHFLIPLISVVFMVMHLVLLHEKGSSNPLGLSYNSDKIEFHPFFSLKDSFSAGCCVFFFMYVSMFFPYIFMDSDNFIPANPLITPVHIQPEWYFLFAYSILRSIPSKLGGVIGLMMSVFIFYIFPFLGKKAVINMYSRLFWLLLVISFIVLTWTGSLPVEEPFVSLSKIASVTYFVGSVGMLVF